MKTAIVCCSNGRPESERQKLRNLKSILERAGITPVFMGPIFDAENGVRLKGKERAEILMDCYKDDHIQAIFDVSGGDIANEILTFLDYDLIKASHKPFFGYSDLTAVINAIYARTGEQSVLYQVKNLTSERCGIQVNDLKAFLTHRSEEIFRFPCTFVQKERMEGVVAGGNIRCLLKLAGTPYWPDMREKILLLEVWGGKIPQLITYLSQLRQMGVFDQIAGILLGTFSTLEAEQGTRAVCELVKEYAGHTLPVAKSPFIGHGEDSKAVLIGQYRCISGN